VSRELFTGPIAHQMLDPKKRGESQLEKWKVFVLLRKNKHGLVLNKGSEVLYQVATCMNKLISSHKVIFKLLHV
jgi:hypothetical protein